MKNRRGVGLLRGLLGVDYAVGAGGSGFSPGGEEPWAPESWRRMGVGMADQAGLIFG